MKGLYRRGNVWWFRHSVAGKQQKQSLGTTDEAEAEKLAAEIIAEPAKARAQPWDVEVKEYLRARQRAGRMSKNAADSRRLVLLRFARDADISSPRQVTHKRVEVWYRALQKKIAEATAQTYVRWVETFLGYLAAERGLNTRPEKVKLDRLKKAKRKPFCTREEVQKLFDTAKGDAEMTFILHCAFDAGLRRGEIAEARPDWFDLQAGLLHVQRSDTWEPKDRDDRTIPLTKGFQQFLEVYGLPSPFMLKGKTLKRVRRWRYRYDFRRPWNELVAKAGLPWVTPHTGRRTFASLLVSSGVSLYKVAIWLGDMERVVQDHYGSLIPKDADIERGRATPVEARDKAGPSAGRSPAPAR